MRKSAILKSIPLPITVELARIPADSAAPEPGSIIDLGRTVNDPVDICVNGQVIARGIVVIADDHFAVEITEIVADESLREAA
jgi:flagellar motor switch protein FliN/FliY